MNLNTHCPQCKSGFRLKDPPPKEGKQIRCTCGEVLTFTYPPAVREALQENGFDPGPRGSEVTKWRSAPDPGAPNFAVVEQDGAHMKWENLRINHTTQNLYGFEESMQNDDEPPKLTLWRTPVPGGWLVLTSNNDAVTFIPNPDHDWDWGISRPQLWESTND